MDQRLAELNKAKQRFDEMNQTPIPKIQKVPVLLQQNERFAKYYSPKMMSFGPIHHGKEILKQGEQYKLLWTSKYVAEYSANQDADRTTQTLLKMVQDDIEQLKNKFTEDALNEVKCDDDDLAWMLFVDGCSLLHFIENADKDHPEALNLKLDQLICLFSDTYLLENQLPRRLLEILSKKKGADLEYLFSNHLTLGESKQNGYVIVSVQNPKPIHALDYARSAYSSPQFIDIGSFNQMVQQNDRVGNNDQVVPKVWCTYKNIRDLKKAGIQVKPSLAKPQEGLFDWTWSNINFTSNCFSGELRLPVFLFNDVTPYFFRNLIAYEMCPDVHHKYECFAFFCFMDSLIDNAEDVKELRSSGVFQNLLGTDEDLANFFNELCGDLPTKMFCDTYSSNAVGFSKKYIAVKLQIEKHYSTRWRTWLAQAYNTHFRTPWAMIAFLAASLALILTFIQTWFSINPR